MKKIPENELHQDAAIVEALGGTVVVAKMFDLTPTAVSMWKRNGIPKGSRMYLQATYPKMFKKLKIK